MGTETGDNSSIDVVHDATIPTGTSITCTLFEDVGNDGAGANTDALGNSYDNSASGSLSAGTGNTLTLTGFDGGSSTNAYWAHLELDGDGTDPTLGPVSVGSLDVQAASGGGASGTGVLQSSGGVIQSSNGVLQTT